MYQANSNAQQMGALTSEIILEKPDSNQVFPIVSLEHKATAISFSNSDYKGVIRAINDLQSDIEKVTGIKPLHYKDGMFYIT